MQSVSSGFKFITVQQILVEEKIRMVTMHIENSMLKKQNISLKGRKIYITLCENRMLRKQNTSLKVVVKIDNSM